MKLLYDLLYEILVYVEQHEEAGPYLAPRINAFTTAQIDYHIRMCEEAGWLQNEGASSTILGDKKYDHYTEIGELT